jgi:hypothetical protein
MANYIGADSSFSDEHVNVWERSDKKERVLKRVKKPLYFYVPDDAGEYTSIYNDKLKKLSFDSLAEFNIAVKAYPQSLRHEADIQPMFKVLMDNYYNLELPILNFAFIDIETDTRKKLGWSTVNNPYAAINAVTIYQSWNDKYITLLLAPKKYDVSKFYEEIEKIAIELDLDFIKNKKVDFQICVNETELLTRFVNEIQNADLLSGWN